MFVVLFLFQCGVVCTFFLHSLKVAEYLMPMAVLFLWPSLLNWVAAFESLTLGTNICRKLLHVRHNANSGISVGFLHFHTCHVK